MLYLLNNIEIQNKLQTIYTYVTVVLDELFAEAPAAISLLIVPYLQFKRFLTFEHGAFFVQTLHTFREKATFEDFTIKPTSQGIKEAKLSSLFVLTVEQRAAATTSGQGTKYHVFLSSNANTDYGLIIPSNFFSFLQGKNYHKLFLKVFQKKGTILRK